MQHLTREALRTELWSMLTDEARQSMAGVKESYLDSLMADIDDYCTGQTDQPVVKDEKESLLNVIDNEARKFALYNYCRPGEVPDEHLQEIFRWPYEAQVCYHTLKNYLSADPVCMPDRKFLFPATPQPSPAKPSVNGELLGFLEIEIEKANKNGKDCNLKDGDLNRARAWYSAAEAFSIVKDKITELLNTPHGPQSSIINCPSCNGVWDLSRHNSCQCGATLVTKASPAKAEQEGPKPISSYLREYSQLKEYEKLLGGGMRPEYTLEQVKAMGWQEVLHMLTGYVDILNLMDGIIYVLEEGAGEWETEAADWKWRFEAVFAALKELTALKAIKEKDGETVDYLARKPKAWATAKELTSGYKIEKREQEELRWVKATMFNYTPNSRYYARWGDGAGAIKSTGWFQQSDGTFFWNENGFVPVLKKEHYQLYILDESTTSVKEAGQPTESEKDFEDLLEAELNKLPYTKHVDDGQYNDGQCAGFELGARWAQSRQQPAESAGVWVPFTKDARLPKNEDFLVKYDTGEIRRYQEEEQPFGIVTHYMILNDESGAYTKEKEIAFAEWIQRKWIPTYENNKLHSWRFFGPHDHEWYGKDYTTSQIYDLWQQSL